MHREESEWLAGCLAEISIDKISPLVNLGSSTRDFREVRQPFIHTRIFAPLAERGVCILHSDIKQDEGVDLVGDICSPEFRAAIKAQQPRAVLCSNMLEHVPDPQAMAACILDVLPPGGLIFVTVPHSYPKHLDPIDTMYRPTPEMLQGLFSGAKILAADVVPVPKIAQSLLRSPLQLAKTLARCCVPFYRRAGWVTAVNRVLWLFRPRDVSCVVLEKA